jgi:hypothetical protein
MLDTAQHNSVRASRLMFTGAVRMRARLSLSIRYLCMADALRLCAEERFDWRSAENMLPLRQLSLG